ncbi:hypothetical protein, conserved [Eimeria brunetti]|uniref:Uncharacterized protein n=1 Tax=Eimeria brunetti TaxID=51314 RepID=U6LPK9_9EIME|nr:hypothetical protein, conserved [Eimeria brunetti]
MLSTSESPRARGTVPIPLTAFPSLPFLTDAYLPVPQAAAATQQQQQLLQPGTTPEPVCAAGGDRLSTAGAEGWADTGVPLQQLQLLGAPREGEVGEFLSGASDPTPFAASYFYPHLCSPSLDNPQTPTMTNSHSSLSPIQLATPPQTGNSSTVVGAAPSGGFPLYCAPPFPSSLPGPLTCGLGLEGPPKDPINPDYTLQQQNATQDTQGFASDYDRLTRELCKYCANLRDLVTDNPSFSDELSSTLEKAIGSADQVNHAQQKFLFSGNQQMHLVADSNVIHSKVHTLHRILQNTIPQYRQWLEGHAVLKEHIQQLEQRHRGFVGSANQGGNELHDSARTSAAAAAGAGGNPPLQQQQQQQHRQAA